MRLVFDPRIRATSKCGEEGNFGAGRRAASKRRIVHFLSRGESTARSCAGVIEVLRSCSLRSSPPWWGTPYVSPRTDQVQAIQHQNIVRKDSDTAERFANDPSTPSSRVQTTTSSGVFCFRHFALDLLGATRPGDYHEVRLDVLGPLGALRRRQKNGHRDASSDVPRTPSAAASRSVPIHANFLIVSTFEYSGKYKVDTLAIGNDVCHCILFRVG